MAVSLWFDRHGLRDVFGLNRGDGFGGEEILNALWEAKARRRRKATVVGVGEEVAGEAPEAGPEEEEEEEDCEVGGADDPLTSDAFDGPPSLADLQGCKPGRGHSGLCEFST
jgi:hypothetical protein